jgi:hypothetical protein
MSKKLYSIGFDKVKLFIQKHKKEFRAVSNENKTNFLLSTFGKSYYELHILNYFKSHNILKNTPFAIKLLEHFKSLDFIIQTIYLSGLDEPLNLTDNQKPNNDEMVQYFYRCCYLLHEKLYYPEINSSLFELNFIHHSVQFQSTSNVKKDSKTILTHMLKDKMPKESFGEDEKGAFFKLIIDGAVIVDLNGKSIKILRKKAYEKLHKMVIDGKVNLRK